MANSTIQSLRDANPYRNQTYQKSPWQNFLSSLGFRTQADAWQENMAVQAAEYDASLAQKEFDLQYDDAQSQVQRMRAAGLNPDINGGQNITPGDPGVMGEDPSTPMQSTGEEGVLLQFGQAVMSSVTSALSIASSVQGIQRTRLENIFQGWQNEGALRDYAEKVFMDSLPESPTTDQFENGFDWKAAGLKNAQGLIKGFKKKDADRLYNLVERYYENGPKEGEAYSAFVDRVKSRKDYYGESNSFYSEWDSVMEVIYEELGGLSEEIFKQNQNAEFMEGVAREDKAEYESALYDQDVDENGNTRGIDAGKQARVANDKADLDRTNISMQKMLRRRLQNMMNKIEAKSQQKGMPGTIASGVLGFLSLLELAVSSGVFSIGGSFVHKF